MVTIQIIELAQDIAALAIIDSRLDCLWVLLGRYEILQSLKCTIIPWHGPDVSS